MIKHIVLFLFSILLSTGIFAQAKTVAVTIDDLPFVRFANRSDAELTSRTSKLLTALSSHHAPATGFVNLSKVYKSGVFDTARFNLLRLWTDEGFDLGNHTFSHPDYNYETFEDFTYDIEQNEPLLNKLLGNYNKQMIYFRHPFLHRGNSKAKVDSLASYLKARNYIEAPVTIDNAEWIFAAAYDSLLKTTDRQLQQKLGNEYVAYMQAKLKYYEGQSQKLFGRNISHILLLHANTLNSDYLSDILDMFVANGYTFVSLSVALNDELYNTPDAYYKKGGISWLDRWAITQGKTRDFFADEPTCPAYVMELAGVDSE